MTERDVPIDQFSRLLLARAGHPVSSDRQYRIASALGPVVRKHGFTDVEMLAQSLARRRDEALEADVVEALLNHETYFFRDRLPFELLDRYFRQKIENGTRQKRHFRIWCAGVSTGQEAYSLAMMFADTAERWNGWIFEILGTDVSDVAIGRAREGLYTQFEVQRGLSARQLITHFEKEGANWRISPAIRARVNFLSQDITREQPRPGSCDAIFCRNILLYMEPETRRRIFDRLHDALVPDGLLLLGAAETTLGQTDRFVADPEYRGAYRRKGSVAKAARGVADTG